MILNRLSLIGRINILFSQIKFDEGVDWYISTTEYAHTFKIKKYLLNIFEDKAELRVLTKTKGYELLAHWGEYELVSAEAHEIFLTRLKSFLVTKENLFIKFYNDFYDCK